MKNLFLTTIALAALFSYSQSKPASNIDLNCKSAKYSVVVNQNNGVLNANYGVNGRMNDGAEVILEDTYISDKIIALSLNIDNQPNKIELAVTKLSSGLFSGKLYFGKVMQSVKCTRK